MFVKNVECKPLKNLSTWRRISLATWKHPRDPSAYGQIEIDCSEMLRWLESQKQNGPKITVTHLLIKAVSNMFATLPELNVLIRNNRLYQREEIDIFVQVFTQEDQKMDLSGAKIRNAHQKSIQQVAKELTMQANKIRSGEDPNLKQSKTFLSLFPFFLIKWALNFLAWTNFDLNIRPKFLNLPPNPFGVAMITNVGMFGIQEAWAPLVPFSRSPMVLTIGEIADQPVVREEKVVIRPMMKIGVTIDHRVIDGFLASQGAKILRENIENPATMEEAKS